ncbi:squalene/phytoene synthase family protein [Acidocella sp.]|uniref:squalene/phytoene synthase family protein n=1 Tax=Acidocella sp. TaxID=50710 RepID=UPI002628443B|nr:squalene/phytoene synthase family protein [Acidocella sp.]
MLASSDAALLRRLSRADPDRYFATLFAPPARRGGLALLYLFNHELARAREVASNPVLALIRLQWWREVVEGIEKPHELATPLSAALAAGDLPREDLLALVGARAAEAEDSPADLAAFLAYARSTGGRLARAAGKILGEDSAAIEDLGTAYAIAGILRAAPFLARQGRSLLPADGTPAAVLKEEALALLAARPPRAAFAAWAPAALVRRDLRHPAPRPRGTLDRLAIVRAALTGRV